MNKIIFVFVAFICFSCGNKKSSKNEMTAKPERPNFDHFSAYHDGGDWILEMERNGNFVFKDFLDNKSFFGATSKPTEFDDGKKGLLYTMRSGDLTLFMKVFVDNCKSSSFANNQFLFEVKNADNLVVYRIGDCGANHEKFYFGNTYLFDIPESKLPPITIRKIEHSKLIEGEFGCRKFKGELNVLDLSISIQYDLAPNLDCQESQEESQFMEIFNGSYYFQFDRNGHVLRLTNKNSTFVLKKVT